MPSSPKEVPIRCDCEVLVRIADLIMRRSLSSGSTRHRRKNKDPASGTRRRDRQVRGRVLRVLFIGD